MPSRTWTFVAALNNIGDRRTTATWHWSMSSVFGSHTMFVMYGLLVAIGVVVVGLVLSSCRCFNSGRSLCHYLSHCNGMAMP